MGGSVIVAMPYSNAKTALNSIKDYQRNKFEIAFNVKDLIYKECSRIFHAYGYER
jgi:hypothetical protein